MIIFSLSDRRSSGFCSDNEKSSGMGRHGWVEIMIIVGHGLDIGGGDNHDCHGNHVHQQ